MKVGVQKSLLKLTAANDNEQVSIEPPNTKKNIISAKERVERLDWIVVEEYEIPVDGIAFSSGGILDDKTIERLGITRYNLTVPVALHLLDTARYPSLSKARKACRQGKIDVCLDDDKDGNVMDPIDNQRQRHLRRSRRALVNDRVSPFDTIQRKETRTIVERECGNLDDYKYGSQPATDNGANATAPTSASTTDQYDVCSIVEPYFKLQVVYEDDYMAIVNKPAGVLVHPESGKGRNNILHALPYVLKKPSCENIHEEDDLVLDSPIAVHRLDFVTSGLLVVGKTKNSVRRLSQQFEYRKAHKTYTAMVFGVPEVDAKQHLHQSHQKIPQYLLDDESPSTSSSLDWNLCQSNIDGKECITWWRIVKSYQYFLPVGGQTRKTTTVGGRFVEGQISPRSSLQSSQNVPISLIELMPETGRYHQLRRQMAWVYNTPMIGDPIYAVNVTTLGAAAATAITSNSRRYHRGLMLCSTQIRIEHPFYNTPVGWRHWQNLVVGQQPMKDEYNTSSSSSSRLYEVPVVLNSHDGDDDYDGHSRPVIMVDTRIPVPQKFEKFQQLLRRMSDQGKSDYA